MQQEIKNSVLGSKVQPLDLKGNKKLEVIKKLNKEMSMLKENAEKY